ncbi:MAG: glycosyltransferase [Candidatus Thermoplasmatota archaeon]|nr:glycosyltransferase [Candidatus Thermoplasmatota archaeon]MCL5253866.1 glycosyltransferase [Candidatus Thermoplasmatota archaeon]
MRVKGIKVGFFGSFYPHVDRLSTTSTGLVTLFSMSEKIERVIVFSPLLSVSPTSLNTSNVRVIPSWRYDRALSLIKTLIKMMKMKNDIDVYIFNIFLTSFGRSKIANVTGLLLPVLLSKLTHKRVCTYMHNFIETQDIENLGYEKKWFATKIASRLERGIANNTFLVVPLESQRLTLEALFHSKVHSVLVPYVEGIYGFISNPIELQNSKSDHNKPLSFLLFGSWGPQKDLDGALKIFKELIDEGNDLRVVIGGKANGNFPHYEKKIEDIIAQFPTKYIRWIKNVPEENVPRLFEDADVLFLPYNAAGGYSAVMNVGAFYDLQIVSYDVPELREFDLIIRAGCTFVDPSKPDEVKKVLVQRATESRRNRRNNQSMPMEKLQKSLRAVDDFIDLIIDRNDPYMVGGQELR